MSFLSSRLPASRAAVRRSASPFNFTRPFALTTLAFAANAAFAQSPPAPDPALLPGVQVTATRTPMRVDETISEVTVIDRAQIDRATGRTLAELLAQQPGIQTTSNGGLGNLSAIYIRGLESRHTLLLIDGVRYGSATVGTPVWDNLPLDSIDHIEIVRGPLSSLYGSDAVGGVVQIFTRHSAPGLHANGNVTIGSHDMHEIGGGLSFGQGAIDGALQVQHTDSRGFSSTNAHVPFGSYNPDRDGFRQNSVNAQIGMALGGGWRVDARGLSSHGETHYDDGPGVDSRAGLRSQVVALEAAGPVMSAWRTKLRLSRSADAYDTIASASPYTDLGTTGTVQQQATWENAITTPIGTALVVAEHLKQTVSAPVTPYTVSDRTINGVALALDGQHGPHTWQASVRHDSNSQYGSENTGALGYGYDLTPSWRAAASYGTSFTAPSFNQLYYPGFGNPNLLPEEGKQGEVSLRWAADGQEVRAAYFDNRIRGYITSGNSPVNLPKTRIDGETITWQAKVAAWSWLASAEHVNPLNRTANNVNFDKQLPRRAKNSVKLGGDVDLGMWQVGATGNAYSHRYDDSANTTRLGGYATLDLHADWRVAPGWVLGLRLNNLADRHYETVYGYNQPGRELYATLRYSGF